MRRRILVPVIGLSVCLSSTAFGAGYTPGTYEASVQGLGGPVTVTMTMDEASITDVQIVGENETPEIGGAAMEALTAAILDAQGAEVDMIAGATVTSTAVLEAAKDCIAQAGGEAAEAAEPDEAEDTPEVTPEDAQQEMQNMLDASAARAEEYAPKIVTLESGVQIQRIPNDTPYWHAPGASASYNTYYLNGDNRGCNACHSSLLDLINNMSYEHLKFPDYGTDLEVDDCRACHTYGDGYIWQTNQLGTLIHGIHSRDTFNGDCMSCHTATEDGMGLRLFDDAKYDILQGIYTIADPEGEFTYDQDTLSDASDAVSLNWETDDYDHLRNASDRVDLPRDEDLFNNWEISVTGEVANPFTITLGELMEQCPSETKVVTNHCVMNPIGGPYISNIEMTGFPISWLLEKAGASEDATAFYSRSTNGWARCTRIADMEKNGSYLAYKFNGEDLTWTQGYPVTTYSPGEAAFAFIRTVCEIEVTTEPVENLKYFDGWYTMDGTPYNKPNCGFFNFYEGQIIEADKPYTFEGYAHGYDKQVVDVEFSLDRGATWQTFDTTDSDYTRWIHWNYTITPPAGAYVLSIRAHDEDGNVTYHPEEVMFNAK